MLLYSWDEELDVCEFGSSPLMQTGMDDCVPGLMVIDVAHVNTSRELENDAVAILKWIQQFSLCNSCGKLE
ncbi:hypothetical protein Tco_0088070 [Tanacetum coccineum]